MLNQPYFKSYRTKAYRKYPKIIEELRITRTAQPLKPQNKKLKEKKCRSLYLRGYEIRTVLTAVFKSNQT